MTTTTTVGCAAGDRRARACRFCAALLAVTLASGCVTTTQVETTVDAPRTTLRPKPEAAAPVSGSFHQEGRTLVGQIAFTQNCTRETRQVVHRQTREMHVNLGWVAMAAAGAVIGLAGVGILAKTDSTDTGLEVTAAGVVISGGGVFELLDSKRTEHHQLPDRERAQSRDHQACGETSALDGLMLTVLVSSSLGQSSGRVGPDGSVRIELPSKLTPSRAPVDIVVDSVPASLTDVLARGAVVGQVSLQP